MDKKEQAKKLELAGFGSKIKDKVIWVYDNGTYIGYLTSSDDGSTGTCKNINRRSGAVAEALRS